MFLTAQKNILVFGAVRAVITHHVWWDKHKTTKRHWKRQFTPKSKIVYFSQRHCCSFFFFQMYFLWHIECHKPTCIKFEKRQTSFLQPISPKTLQLSLKQFSLINSTARKVEKFVFLILGWILPLDFINVKCNEHRPELMFDCQVKCSSVQSPGSPKYSGGLMKIEGQGRKFFKKGHQLYAVGHWRGT